MVHDLREPFDGVADPGTTGAEDDLRFRLAPHVYLSRTRLSFGRRLAIDIRNWSAVFRRPVGGPNDLMAGCELLDVNGPRNEADAGQVDLAPTGVYDTVLVDVPEVMKSFERSRPLRFLVRLCAI